MKIVITEYKEDVPVKVNAEYDPKKLELELVDLKFLESLKLDGEVLRESSVVTFTGNLHSRVRRICGRTLAEVDEDLDIPFRLFYPIADADVIDTLDDLREAVLIEQPMVYYAPGSEPLADEDESDEETEMKVANRPFDKLKDVRNRFKEEDKDGAS